MKTTDMFDYEGCVSHYANCFFEVDKYRNGNNYLAIVNDEEGPIAVCSVNADRINEKDEIGIKNYSENEGMVDFLKGMGIIEEEPIAIEHSGFVIIPYFKLTDEGKELFGI